MLRYLPYLAKDRHIASITPTAAGVVGRLCSTLDFKRDLSLVEFGPGLGVFSEYLLGKMTPGSRLDLFETNDAFVEALRGRLGTDRVGLHHRSAAEAVDALGEGARGSVDAVISGIPFSMMSEEARDSIFGSVRELLGPGGQFLVYQVRPMFKNRVGLDLSDHLEKHFSAVLIEDTYLNIPPLRLYRAIG